MIKSIVLLFIPCLIYGQNISIDPKDFSNANIELKRAVLENRNVKGSPYLDEEFSSTRITFADGKSFKGAMRFHTTHNAFEFKSSKDGEIYELRLTDGMKAYHLGKTFSAHFLSTENKVATFELIASPNPYGLYRFHFKSIENSPREAIGLPSSNQGNNKDASWVDNSYFLLLKGTEVYQLTKSHKKVMKSGIVDPEIYKKLIKEHKYKLTKQKDLKELVEQLNRHQ